MLDHFGFGVHLGDDPFGIGDQFLGCLSHFVMHQIGNCVLVLNHLLEGRDVGLELFVQLG